MKKAPFVLIVLLDYVQTMDFQEEYWIKNGKRFSALGGRHYLELSVAEVTNCSNTVVSPL